MFATFSAKSNKFLLTHRDSGDFFRKFDKILPPTVAKDWKRALFSKVWVSNVIKYMADIPETLRMWCTHEYFISWEFEQLLQLSWAFGALFRQCLTKISLNQSFLGQNIRQKSIQKCRLPCQIDLKPPEIDSWGNFRSKKTTAHFISSILTHFSVKLCDFSPIFTVFKKILCIWSKSITKSEVFGTFWIWETWIFNIF